MTPFILLTVIFIYLYSLSDKENDYLKKVIKENIDEPNTYLEKRAYSTKALDITFGVLLLLVLSSFSYDYLREKPNRQKAKPQIIKETKP